MPNFVFANNIKTVVAADFSSTATVLTILSATGLPTLGSGQVMPITLNDAATGNVFEICYATAISGNSLTVERAKEGTIAQSWQTNDYAYCSPTAQSVAASGGNPSNQFMVADATAGDQAVSLNQLDGVSSAVSAETTRAETAESSLSSAISAETTRAEGAESSLSSAISAETARAEAEETHLQNQIGSVGSTDLQTQINNIIAGIAAAVFATNTTVTAGLQLSIATSNSSIPNVIILIGSYTGGGVITFPNAFPTSCMAFVPIATVSSGNQYYLSIEPGTLTRFGVTISGLDPAVGGGVPDGYFIAAGY